MPERIAVFYECQDVEDEDPFDRIAAVEGINELADEDWVVPHWRGDFLAVIVDEAGDANTPSHLRFLRIRENAPYVLTAARSLSPIEIQEDERISEFTHVVLFRDGFMGAIASRDAPSHKWLADYFAVASDQHTHIVNLYRRDVVKRLKELREGGLTHAQVKVRTSELEQIVRDNQDLKGFKSLRTAGKGADAVTIGIEYSVDRFKTVLSPSIGKEMQEIAEYRDSLEKMIVSGKDKAGNRDTINMKKERIAWGVNLEPTDQDNAYYAAIRRARRDLKPSMGTLAQAARGN